MCNYVVCRHCKGDVAEGLYHQCPTMVTRKIPEKKARTGCPHFVPKNLIGNIPDIYVNNNNMCSGGGLGW